MQKTVQEKLAKRKASLAAPVWCSRRPGDLAQDQFTTLAESPGPDVLRLQYKHNTSVLRTYCVCNIRAVKVGLVTRDGIRPPMNDASFIDIRMRWRSRPNRLKGPRVCSNYRPVTSSDRMLSFFGVERDVDQVPADVWPTGLAPFIRLGEPGSTSKFVVHEGLFGLALVWQPHRHIDYDPIMTITPNSKIDAVESALGSLSADELAEALALLASGESIESVIAQIRQKRARDRDRQR